MKRTTKKTEPQFIEDVPADGITGEEPVEPQFIEDVPADGIVTAAGHDVRRDVDPSQDGNPFSDETGEYIGG